MPIIAFLCWHLDVVVFIHFRHGPCHISMVLAFPRMCRWTVCSILVPDADDTRWMLFKISKPQCQLCWFNIGDRGGRPEGIPWKQEKTEVTWKRVKWNLKMYKAMTVNYVNPSGRIHIPLMTILTIWTLCTTKSDKDIFPLNTHETSDQFWIVSMWSFTIYAWIKSLLK